MFGRDRHTVYLEKLGLTAPLVETQAMELGNWLEDPIARYWSQVTGLPVRRHRATIRHPEKDYLFTHVDRVVADRAQKLDEITEILEVKNTGIFRASDFGEQDSDQVPEGYLIQAAHTMVVLPNVQRVYLAALLGGTGFRKFVIDRDDDLLAEIEEQETRFWTENVVPRVPPEIDGTEGAGRTLAHLYPEERGEELEADEEYDELARRYLAAVAAMKDAEERKALHAQEIQARMGTAAIVAGNGYRIAWTNTKGQPRWKEVAVELAQGDDRLLAAAAENHRTPAGRRFAVTRKEVSQ